MNMKTRNDGCQREVPTCKKHIGICAKPTSAESGQKAGLTTSRVAGKGVPAWETAGSNGALSQTPTNTRGAGQKHNCPPYD